MHNPKKILIIKTGALGDMVLASVFFQSVKENFPESRLYLLTHERYREVVEACPLFDGIFTLTDRFSADVRMLLEIRRRCMDLVLDFQGGLKTNMLALFSGARVKTGVYESVLGGQVFSTKALRVPSGGPIESQFPLLRKMGLQRFCRQLRVWVPAEKRKTFPVFLSGLGIDPARRWAVIHPGASREWPTKRWTDDNYAALADALAEKKYEIVFVGEAGDREWIASLTGRMKLPAVNAAGRTSFVELYLLLESAALTVTTDSAPLHMAAAAGVPVIALFGPTDPAKHCPPGAAVLFHPGPCGPCYRKKCERHVCMKSVTVADVLGKI